MCSNYKEFISNKYATYNFWQKRCPTIDDFLFETVAPDLLFTRLTEKLVYNESTFNLQLSDA